MSTLIVTAKAEAGFRRIGRHFTRQPTELAVEDLTEAEIKALRDEPALVVHDGAETGEVKSPKAAAKPKGAK